METKTIAAIILALIIGVAIGIPVGYYVLAPKPPEEEVPVTLEFWAPFAGEEAGLWFWQNASNAFYNETGTTVKISFYTGEEFWTKLASSFAAGAPPDLYITYGGGELETYVAEGQAEDISDLLSEDWALAQIKPGVRAAVTINGSQWAVPAELHSDWLFINKDLYEQYDIEIPTLEEGWTWDEFIAACETLKANGIIPIAMSGAAKWSLNIMTYYFIERLNGPDAFLGAYNRSTSFFGTMNKSYAKIQEFVEGDYFQEGWQTAGYMDAWGAFTGKSAAMWFQGTWAVAMCPDAEGFTLDVVPFPYFPEFSSESRVRDWLSGGVTSVAVAAQGQHKAEAKAFLKFISRPEWQILMGKLSGSPLAQDISLPSGLYPSTTVKCMEAVAAAPVFSLRYGTLCITEFGDVFDEQNDKVWAQTTTPAAAATAMEEGAVSILGPVGG